MRRGWTLLACGLLAPSAWAGENAPSASVGYAFALYAEEGGGNAPLGGYVSVAARRRVGWDVDLGYQRDSGRLFSESVVLNTATAALGIRVTGSQRARPFAHVLGGLRYDSLEGESNTSFGGMAGGGVDIPAGAVAVRVGADFQIFFEGGENLKTIRLAAGLTF